LASSFFVLATAAMVFFCNLHAQLKPEAQQAEVIYHLFLRSFYDSNGDGHGDLTGLREKLDYLQELGVTSVLLTPLYASDFYHNYFPIDFEKIDPEFGTKEDYFALLNEMHRRGMKLYMDMEIHYVTADHLWYKDSFQNPSSPYSEYIVYNGPNNTDPESIIHNLTDMLSYDGKIIKFCTINLYHQKVKDYFYHLFAYWVDPNSDGEFDDGIDGFRIDHMLDDLDWKGKITGLLANFWKPLIHQLQLINPNVVFFAEQGDWGYGADYFLQGDVSSVFAFPLSQAIRQLNKKGIQNKADTTQLATPQNKCQLIFIENHDMPRIATVFQGSLAKLKIGAALTILLKGVPTIYYGQELGMTGANGFGKFGVSDGNDIPVREAFEWYKTVAGKGMALWYKNSGPWWDQTQLRDNDGISLEEQKSDSSSLWNFYKTLLAFRQDNPIIQTGSMKFVENDNKNVISFLRWEKEEAILVIINLSDCNETANLEMANFSLKTDKPKFSNLLHQAKEKPIIKAGQNISVILSPFEIQVW